MHGLRPDEIIDEGVTSDAPEPEGALFIMPRPSTGQVGPVAVWVTASGWAEAAGRLWGESWLITPEGVMGPDEARAMASHGGLAPRPPSWRRFVPKTLKSALKDVREWRKGSAFDRSIEVEPWRSKRLAFVWQRHDLFHHGGLHLARELGVPFVLFVDAPVVWEARRWGVRRPGWGSLLEKFDENPLFRAADLIACVSDEVADEIARRGVLRDRILVTPCGVDVHSFTPSAPGDVIRERHSLTDRFVLGWIGSFRQFHGIDLALDTLASLRKTHPNATLMLVGDGSERPRLEEKAGEMGLHDVVFTGTVGHSEIPAHLAAMDVALVLNAEGGSFHYSPLKLREYMACGRPVIAPRVGELTRVVADGEDGLLVPPGDAEAVADAARRLIEDPDLRASLGKAARESAVRESSWEQQVLRAYRAVRAGS